MRVESYKLAVTGQLELGQEVPYSYVKSVYTTIFLLECGTYGFGPYRSTRVILHKILPPIRKNVSNER